jgi:signal transduction histidine kinase
LADRELARVTEISKQVLGLHRQAAEAVEFKLTDVLDGALSFYTLQLREAFIEVRRDYRDSPLLVSAPGEMRQIFSNLIGNAIEVLPGGGMLQLRVSEYHSLTHGPSVRVTITDNGPGISATVRRRIFEPFFTTKGAHGTGLGLWVVRGLVRKHHGTVRVRTATQGRWRGTCFSVVFPKVDVASDPAAGDSPMLRTKE